MRPNTRFQRHEPTKLDRLNALKTFLCSARDPIVMAATVDEMMRYGCDRKVTEYQLTVAKQNIARRVAEAAGE